MPNDITDAEESKTKGQETNGSRQENIPLAEMEIKIVPAAGEEMWIRLDKGKMEGNDQEKEDKQNKDTGGDSEDGKHSPDKRMPPEKKKQYLIIGIIVGVVVATGIILFWLHARQYETTDDAFIDGHVSQISARVGGQIQSLLIIDNQHVEAGQLLAEIDPRDYEVRLAQAQAQQKQAVAQTALQLANVGVARSAVFEADRDLKRFQAVDPRAVSRQQNDSAIANDLSAHARLEAAQAQEETAKAALQQANADIDNAKLQLSYTKIVAPISGYIARRTVEPGNVVAPGVPLMAVVSDDLWVTANYKETQLTRMRVGQKVRIEVDSFPSVAFFGHVDSFQRGTGSEFSILPAENATGNYVKVVQRIPIKITFDNLEQRDKYPLAPGMSVDPRVTVR